MSKPYMSKWWTNNSTSSCKMKKCTQCFSFIGPTYRHHGCHTEKNQKKKNMANQRRTPQRAPEVQENITEILCKAGDWTDGTPAMMDRENNDDNKGRVLSVVGLNTHKDKSTGLPSAARLAGILFL